MIDSIMRERMSEAAVVEGRKKAEKEWPDIYSDCEIVARKHGLSVEELTSLKFDGANVPRRLVIKRAKEHYDSAQNLVLRMFSYKQRSVK